MRIRSRDVEMRFRLEHETLIELGLGKPQMTLRHRELTWRASNCTVALRLIRNFRETREVTSHHGDLRTGRLRERDDDECRKAKRAARDPSGRFDRVVVLRRAFHRPDPSCACLESTMAFSACSSAMPANLIASP